MIDIINITNISKTEDKEYFPLAINMGNNNNQEKDLKIKGYGFDSLCLRYNQARDAQAEWEIYHKRMDPESSYKLAKRDKLRFYEILNDLIGEHD